MRILVGWKKGISGKAPGFMRETFLAWKSFGQRHTGLESGKVLGLFYSECLKILLFFNTNIISTLDNSITFSSIRHFHELPCHVIGNNRCIGSRQLGIVSVHYVQSWAQNHYFISRYRYSLQLLVTITCYRYSCFGKYE